MPLEPRIRPTEMDAEACFDTGQRGERDAAQGKEAAYRYLKEERHLVDIAGIKGTVGPTVL